MITEQGVVIDAGSTVIFKRNVGAMVTKRKTTSGNSN
jgi:hypothetical protein